MQPPILPFPPTNVGVAGAEKTRRSRPRAKQLPRPRWLIKPPGDQQEIKRLSGELGIAPVLADILLWRGIKTPQQAEEFFNPDLQRLHDPFLMKDMDAAVERLEKAINGGEKILVYGDYDVDGTTAVALVWSFISRQLGLGDRAGYYIPDRYAEGYGVSVQGVNYAADNGYALVVALDCGISAHNAIQLAKERGVDFIVCDHHLPPGLKQLPPAVAVLDPQRPDCTYPYKELSGCGIGFKLVCALAARKGIPFSDLEQYLDLVALSIASDIVPITGENRILTHHGLNKINTAPSPGIKALIEENRLTKALTVNNLVFIIGPRINAAGRMDHGRIAVELLTAANEHTARETAKTLCATNAERQNLDEHITRQALEMVERDPVLVQRKTTVLYHPDWHKGVIGIVAARLIESYHRPTIILTRTDGKATGSARSVKGFNIYNALEGCQDLLENFGGHRYAAGLTLRLEKLDEFISRFERVVSETIDEKLLTPSIDINAVISPGDISWDFFRTLQRFAPFGPGNMPPVFLSKGVSDTGYAAVVGIDHLKMRISDPQQPGPSFNAIAFGMGDRLETVRKVVAFDVCYCLEENHWKETVSIQMKVKDLRVTPSDGNL